MNNINKKLALVTIFTALAPSLAIAKGFYATAQLGYSQQAGESEAYGENIAQDADFPEEFDSGDGAVGGIGIGYVLNEKFRIESRFSYRDADFKETQFGSGAREGEEYILDGSIESTALTIEGFYDFTNKTAFTPYIKAGLGIVKNNYSARLGGQGVAAFDAFDGTEDGYYDNYADDDSTDLTWNIGLGVNYKISETLRLFGEYQYASFGEVKTGQDSFTDGFKIDDMTSHEFMFGVSFTL